MPIFSRILVVEDEVNTREGLVQFLESLNYEVITAANGKEGLAEFEHSKPDLVLADIRMPEMDGITLLENIKNQNLNAKVILLTAYGSVEDAVKAMNKGAFYYLTKPVNLEEVAFQVRKALSSRELEEENVELKQALFKEKFETGQIISESNRMKEVLNTVDKIARSNATVLVEGESGTGKELIAHEIHRLSARRNQPFVAVHCAALTETLLTSELFGHEKGAFTGAVDRKAGRFEKAHMGTLFLDEIGEITKDTQVKLLRVLQDGCFERVGGTKTIKSDVRLICATNKNLLQEVREGRFREDLYYRINVIYLKMPPLRERKEDIPQLVQYFIDHFTKANSKKITGIEPEALQALVNYDWPGNVREVKNIIERMVVLNNGPQITIKSIPEDLKRSSKNDNSVKFNEGSSASTNLSDLEKETISKVLKEVSGNKSLAAKKLGISRRTLYRKLEEYNLV